MPKLIGLLGAPGPGQTIRHAYKPTGKAIPKKTDPTNGDPYNRLISSSEGYSINDSIAKKTKIS